MFMYLISTCYMTQCHMECMPAEITVKSLPTEAQFLPQDNEVMHYIKFQTILCNKSWHSCMVTKQADAKHGSLACNSRCKLLNPLWINWPLFHQLVVEECQITFNYHHTMQISRINSMYLPQDLIRKDKNPFTKILWDRYER